GVLQQSFNGRKGPGHHIGTQFGTVNNVHGMADRSGQDFGLKGIIVINEPDFGNQVEAIGGDIVQTPQKGGYVIGPGLGGQQGLSGRENQGAIGADSLVREIFQCLDTVADHGDLDHDLFVQLGQFLPFPDHSGQIGGHDLGGNVAIDDIADNHIVF